VLQGKFIAIRAYILKTELNAMPHACNPGYSGSREQEDHGSKPDQANNS
jgi:hypothetical protein